MTRDVKVRLAPETDGFLVGSPAPALLLKQLLAADRRKVYVLDDDATGTQTVADVDVMLRPSQTTISRFASSSSRSCFVLTNSRVLPEAEAVGTLTNLRQDILAAERATGREPAFILRGDSTLRGHVFAEADVFGASRSVLLFIPAFPEGGRVTRRGAQWVRIDRRFVNAADTEFAADEVFGYRSRDLISWVREVGGGRQASIVSLHALRTVGPASIRNALASADPGSVVIAEATLRTDLERIAIGLLQAEAAGSDVVVRSASTFAAVRADLPSRAVDRVEVRVPGRVLIVCGSTTQASTRQIDRLAELGVAVHTFRLADRGVNARVAQDLDTAGVAVLATERDRDPKSREVESGERIMDGLVAAVIRLTGHFESVIGKGGTTSGRIAIGLGAATAHVRGQLDPGVALWDLRLEDGSTMPLAIVPGNVGATDTLARVVRRFDIELGRTRRPQKAAS